MIIDKDYLLKKPAGPSAPKLFFDTRVIPLAVNGAGELEELLDRASARTGVRPAVILAGVASMVSLGLFGLFRRWNKARPVADFCR